MKKTQIGSTLGTIGIVGGMFYAMKNNKGFMGYATFGLLFGLGGLLIGNALEKFYEN
jgi:hypothetical protein